MSVCPFVCLSLCLSVREHISEITSDLHPILRMLHMPMGRSSSGGVAINCPAGFVDDVMFLCFLSVGKATYSS